MNRPSSSRPKRTAAGWEPARSPSGTMATTSTVADALPSPSPSPESSSSKNNNDAHPPSPPKPKHTLRILCFGDSLTSGYSQLGTSLHSYSHALSNTLSRAFPSLRIEAHVDGLPGDLVSGGGSQYLRRIEPKFLTKGGGTPYDWTVVLGGTNDLAFQLSAEQIYEGLREVWKVPLSKGGRVLACTIPEAGVSGPVGNRIKKRRDAVNEMIKSHKQENFHVFDLNVAVPFFSMRDDERKRYWDDHIHLTPDGYDLMGEKIAAAMVNIIMPPGRLQVANVERQPKRRRLFKDDENLFDEEDGDDTALEHGYIVVRRKDLE